MTSDPLWLTLAVLGAVLVTAVVAIVALACSILYGGSARLDREDVR